MAECIVFEDLGSKSLLLPPDYSLLGQTLLSFTCGPSAECKRALVNICIFYALLY